MQIINMALIFEVMMYSFLGLLVNYALVFIIHFLMPKRVLENYFKKPYFSQSEIMLFSGFPLCFMRTIIFMRVLGFPLSGNKRGLKKAYETAPVWLCKSSKYAIISFLVSFLVFLLSIAITGTHMILNVNAQ